MINELIDELIDHLQSSIEDIFDVFEDKSLESIGADSYPALNILTGDETLTSISGGNSNKVMKSDLIISIQVITARDNSKDCKSITDAIKIALCDYKSPQGQVPQGVATDVTDDRMVRTITTIMTTRYSQNGNS